jgi:hypothetical protein
MLPRLVCRRQPGPVRYVPARANVPSAPATPPSTPFADSALIACVELAAAAATPLKLLETKSADSNCSDSNSAPAPPPSPAYSIAPAVAATDKAGRDAVSSSSSLAGISSSSTGLGISINGGPGSSPSSTWSLGGMADASAANNANNASNNPAPAMLDAEYLSFLDTATLVAIVAQKQRDADERAVAALWPPPASIAGSGDSVSEARCSTAAALLAPPALSAEQPPALSHEHQTPIVAINAPAAQQDLLTSEDNNEEQQVEDCWAIAAAADENAANDNDGDGAIDNNENDECDADLAEGGDPFVLLQEDPLALARYYQGLSGDRYDNGWTDGSDSDDALVMIGGGGEGENDKEGDGGDGGADEAAFSRREIVAEALRSRIASGAARIADERVFLRDLMEQHERDVRAQVLGTERVLRAAGGALQAACEAEAVAAATPDAATRVAIAVATTLLACGAALIARAASDYLMGWLV